MPCHRLLRIRGVFTEGQYAYAVLVDLLDDKIRLAQHESGLHFIDALLDDLDGILLGHVVGAFLVKDRCAKILGVALRPVLDLVEGPKIIQVIQRSTLALIIST